MRVRCIAISFHPILGAREVPGAVSDVESEDERILARTLIPVEAADMSHSYDRSSDPID
jgi:hypothetical protein